MLHKKNKMQRFLHVLMFTLLMSTCSVVILAQTNITLVGQLSYDTSLSDIWGYFDQDTGTEYAIVGLNNGTSVVSLADPANPVEVFNEPGPSTIWRDMKVWGDYAYITNEADGGLLILDLTGLPDLVTPYYWNGSEDDNFDVSFDSAHNIFMDENGVAYIVGANFGVGGAIMIDCDANPINPPVLGIYNDRYVHDCYVRNDTLWTAEINNGLLSVIDVSNKANPTVWSTIATPGNFAHNCWLSDDGNTIFTTDEISGGYIGVFDVSNIFDMEEIDRVRSNDGSGVIPHNSFVRGNFVITSYYRDGVTIHDATFPEMTIQVGNYDTSPLEGNGFNGCWGVYPYAPSGLIYASDMEGGLFILQPNYVQAAYLTGSVTDAENNQPLFDASITIDGTDNAATTSFIGEFQTGVTESGSYTITITAVGYEPQTVTVDLVNGEITDLDISLVPLPTFAYNGTVVDAVTLEPVENAVVQLTSEVISYETTTDEAGNFVVNSVLADTYNIIVGQWGYVTQQVSSDFVTPETPDANIALVPGYYDDFALDLGWTTEGDAPTGQWELADPYGTFTGGGVSNPAVDVAGDIGENCYVTGNANDDGVGTDDVDDGFVRLLSPYFDLTGYGEAEISYYRWFYNGGGFGNPNDELIVSISNGINTVVVETIDVNGDLSQWIQNSFIVSDYITPTNAMRFIIETSDAADTGHLVEAGLDFFTVTDLLIDGTPTIQADTNIAIAPNPAVNFIQISSDTNFETLAIYNVSGQLVMQRNVGTTNNASVSVQELPQGIYTLLLQNQQGRSATEKLLIVR